MKVKIKSWERMVEEFGYIINGIIEVQDKNYINLSKFFWHKAVEECLPEDRIIEVEIRDELIYVEQYYYQGFWISEDAIEEYLADESGNDLTNPLQPINYELLADFGIEQKFKLKPIAEILEKATLTNNNLAIFKQIHNKSHLCHYTKFQLDYDINTSIRFIHAFDDRPELVGKFIYKHHEEKLFSIIEPQLAEHFIKTQCSNEAEEFINRYVGQGKDKKYRRIKVTKDSLFRYFEN